MLANPVFATDQRTFSILEVIGDGDPTPVILEPGVFLIRHFSLDNLIDMPEPRFDYQYPDFEEAYHKRIPVISPDEGDHGYFNCYGVCDSPEQFMALVGDLLKKDERTFVVSFTHIEKVPGSKGGWRWHKWGPYIGTRPHHYEYLADEDGFDDGVFVYHVLQLGGPLYVPDWKKRLLESQKRKCTCGNPEAGFDCVCEFVKTHPGTNEYSCEFCGIYTAGAPRCNKCERTDQ